MKNDVYKADEIMVRRLLRDKSLEKRVTAQNKMVPIMQIDLPDDVLRHMATFLFHDVNSKVYKEIEDTEYYKYVMGEIVQNAFHLNTRFKQIFTFYRQYSVVCYTYHISHPHTNRLMQMYICNTCGNYRNYNLVCMCKCTDFI